MNIDDKNNLKIGDFINIRTGNKNIYEIREIINIRSEKEGYILQIDGRIKFKNSDHYITKVVDEEGCNSLNLEKIDIDNVQKEYEYPNDFLEFVNKNNLKYPQKNTKTGKALLAMINNPYKYWKREHCDEYVKKYNIDTKDSIQLFNKHEQWGLKTSDEKGKNYIIYPYELSNKHKMRKNFVFDGTQEQKNNEINKIKSTIKNDYIDSPNNEWQLGHKNPESEDNSNCNLVLQPPIQGKYRDKYIFIDTLTKIPTPKTFMELYYSKQLLYTSKQLIDLRNFLNSLNITP